MGRLQNYNPSIQNKGLNGLVSEVYRNETTIFSNGLNEVTIFEKICNYSFEKYRFRTLSLVRGTAYLKYYKNDELLYSFQYYGYPTDVPKDKGFMNIPIQQGDRIKVTISSDLPAGENFFTAYDVRMELQHAYLESQFEVVS